MPRRAFLPEGRALGGLYSTAQHVSGAAQLRLLSMNARNVKTLFGVELAVSLAQAPTALWNHANASPCTIGHLEHFAQQLLRRAIALESDHAAVRVLNFMPAGFQLNNSAPNSIKQIERLKPRDDQRNFVLLRQRRILPIPHHAAHVPRQKKSLHLVSRRLKNSFNCRRNQNMRHEHRKVFEAPALGQVDAHGVRRSSGFKTDPKEHNLAIGILDREVNRVQWRIHHAHVTTRAFYLKQITLGTGNAQHVAEGTKDH